MSVKKIGGTYGYYKQNEFKNWKDKKLLGSMKFWSMGIKGREKRRNPKKFSPLFLYCDKF